MAETYYIPQWNELFETAESRKRKTKHRWVSIPNNHDGAAYGRVVSHERNCDLLAAWWAIVQVASKMPIRGVLVDENGPLGATDLAMMTRLPAEVFELAFEVLTNPKVNWLVPKSRDLPLFAMMLETSPAPPGKSPTPPGKSPTPPGKSPTPVEKVSTGSGKTPTTGPVPDPTRPDSTLPNPTRPDHEEKKAGPGFNQVVRAGPDRGHNGNGREAIAQQATVKFRNELCIRLAEAFHLRGDRLLSQRRSFLAIARVIETRPDREIDLIDLVALAREKQAAGLDKPIAAFQKTVNERYPACAARGPPVRC